MREGRWAMAGAGASRLHTEFCVPVLKALTFATIMLVMEGCEVGAPARVETPADTAAGEIPFRLAGSNEAALIVDVFLNGQGPFEFVLDTGATLTCIDRDLAERLNLEDARGMVVGSGVGGARRVSLVRIDSLRAGRSTVDDLLGCTLQLDQLQRLPGIEMEGLLGLNFLRSFRVTLDFERSILRLDEPR
jgi:predicted aspartyl protease